MSSEKKAKHFIQHPKYPGGPAELTKFIYAQLRYPAAALAANVEGVVLVEYDIDFQGNVVDTRVIQSLGHGCDEEACRVVRLLKFDVAKNRGVHVLFHQKARIQFKKPVPKKVAPTPPAPQPVPSGEMQLQYTVVTSSPTPQKEEPKPAPVYSYTVTL